MDQLQQHSEIIFLYAIFNYAMEMLIIVLIFISAPYNPSGAVGALFPGTWYVESIDTMHRRHYGRVPTEPHKSTDPAHATGNVQTVTDAAALLVDPVKG